MKKAKPITITIYADPETRAIAEGRAKLIRKEFDMPPNYEYWIVRFVGDYVNDDVGRIIHKLDLPRENQIS